MQFLRAPLDLVQGEGGATTVDCGDNYNGNVDGGGGVVSSFSTDCGTGMVWLRSVAICLFHFLYCYQMIGRE